MLWRCALGRSGQVSNIITRFQKLQKFLEESEEDLQAILEQIANTGSQLLELLESKTDTLNKINQEIGLQNA